MRPPAHYAPTSDAVSRYLVMDGLHQAWSNLARDERALGGDSQFTAELQERADRWLLRAEKALLDAAKEVEATRKGRASP